MKVRIVTTKERPLTPRQKAFALAYARDGGPAYKAAIAAGYSPATASHRACMLLKQSRIWSVIDAEIEAQRRAEDAAHARANKIDRAKIREAARATVERMLHPRRNERNPANA